MICQTCVCARSSRRTLRAQRCAGLAFRSFALFVPLLASSVPLSGLSIGIEVVPSAACRMQHTSTIAPLDVQTMGGLGCPGRTSASSRYRRNRSAPVSHSSICQVSGAELRVRQAQQSRATGAPRCAVAAQRTAAMRCDALSRITACGFARVRGRYGPPPPSASCAPQQRIALRNLFERLLRHLVHRHAHLPPHLDVLHSSRQHDGSGVADSVTQPRRQRATNIHAMSVGRAKQTCRAWFASVGNVVCVRARTPTARSLGSERI